MTMNHNKKRNVGIIYELLVRAVSSYLVDNDKGRAQIALDILSRHYNKHTELYKEFRLFNALAKTTVKDTSVAAAILTESRSASKRFDSVKIDKEKSSLIKEINYNLVDTNFYRRNVPDYRVYATIQTLLNQWRQGDRSNLAESVIIESNLIEWLTSEKQVETIQEVNPNVDALVVKIMNEKFNKKYNDKLTLEQKELINDYVFSMKNDDGRSISYKAEILRKSTINKLNELRSDEKNPVLLEKSEIVLERLNSLNFDKIDDEKISKLMTMIQLVKEIKEA